MMIGRKPLTAATMLILVMNFFRGHTLTCHRSEYQTGNECCPMCPAGSRIRADCTEFRSTSCLPCIEGTHMDKPNGLRQCFACSVCHTGFGLKIKRECTPTSDTVCEPMEGFYCTNSAEDSCMEAEKHASCPPGQYISQAGTSSRDTECSDCRDGTFSNGTFTSCRLHTQCDTKNLQLIKPGNVSTDAECGEQTQTDRTEIVIGIVSFLLICGAAGLLAYYKRKKIISLYRERKRNPDNPKRKPLNEDEAAVQISDRCQQLQDKDKRVDSRLGTAGYYQVGHGTH
ncbi:tumor necrosis factor receptor superfamily member 14-like [Symphorus nematophorus]